MTIKVDIFVSGAGPVGLFFAYQMAQWDHSVFIVDPKPGPTDQSRAILITSRSMEVLENAGLAADILRESFVNCGMRVFKDGAMASQVDVCGDTPFAHNTILMQGKTEEIISQRLTEDTSCKIHWETELVTYTQDENGVKSTIRDINTKQEQVIESTYIVGADGSHSRVRKDNPDWTYEGVAIQTKFILADLILSGDNVEPLMDRMNVFFTGTNATGMVRLIPQCPTRNDSHVFRVFGNLEAYQINKLEQNRVNYGLDKSGGPPTLEFIQEWLNKATAPLKFTASDVIWAAYFKINERIANGFRKKRAFLIGDSAHCHSPVGGQGMNLGLQDAHNLAWKMSAVLKGSSSDPEKLLDSYNEEREPQARATIQFTSSTTKVGLQGNAIVASIRNSMVSMALMLPQIRQMLYKTVMQQFIVVDSKLSSIMNHVSDKGLIEAGHFLPETGALRKSIVTSNSSHRTHRIERFSLRELLVANDKYTVIFVGTCLPSNIPNLHLIEKFWKDTISKPIRRLVIQSACHSNFMAKLPEYVLEEEASIAEESFYSEEQIDFPNSVCNRVGLYSFLNSYFAGEHPYSVVLFVRPDLYVSHAKLVKNESELDEVLQCINTLF